MLKLKSQLFQIIILSLCAVHGFCVGIIESKNTNNPVNYDTRTLDELYKKLTEISEEIVVLRNQNVELNGKLDGYRKDEDVKFSSILEKLNKIDENFIEVKTENQKSLQPLQEFGSTLNELKQFEEKQTRVLENFNQSRNDAIITVNITNFPEFSNQLKLSLDESSTSYASCEEALKYNGHSGVYSLRIQNSENSETFKVYCLKEHINGCAYWTIIQRRNMNSGHSIYFNRNWEEYRNGFGDLEYDHWLGLEKIFTLTNSGRYQLWSKAANGTEAVTRIHNNFRIDNRNDFKFTLSHGNIKENRQIGDCSNKRFNTIDRGDTAWVNSEGGGGGFWGPCDANYNSQILKDGKWQIDKISVPREATYVHLAIGKMRET